MISPTSFFLLFCFLLAGRDTVTHRLLSDLTDPIAVLLIYCSLACVYGWAFKWYRTGSSDIWSEFKNLTGSQKATFMKLGLSTTAVYASLIFGLFYSGATLFSFVDYGVMPLLTIAMAVLIAKEAPDRWVILGSAIALIGVAIFFVYSSNISWKLNLGLVLAGIGATSTAISTVYQKKQLDSGLRADVVLMFRFPVPAIVAAIAAVIMRPSIEMNDLPLLVPVSFFCFFLPLFFMCSGLARSSLLKFSPFFFIIPILTFALGPLLVQSEWEKLTDPFVMTGMAIVLSGFLIAEVGEKIRMRLARPHGRVPEDRVLHKPEPIVDERQGENA